MSTTPTTRRGRDAAEADAERQAAATTMIRDRRFLWSWLAVATICSIACNVGDAWHRQAASTSTTAMFWMALVAAFIPPILLMLSVEALPTLARMLAKEQNDRLLNLVVWTVVVGAFGWSATGIYEIVVVLGVPTNVAWVAPVVIDASVFGATRGLVLTAPVAARAKVGLVRPVTSAAGTESQSVSQTSVSTYTAPRTAEHAQASGRQSAQERPPSPLASTTSAAAPTELPTPTPADHATATRIVADGRTAKPADEVAAVIAGHRAGMRQGELARAVGWHRTTVRPVIEAADELAGEEDDAEPGRPRSLAVIG